MRAETAAQLMAFIDRLPPDAAPSVTLAGGDPTAYSGLLDFITSLRAGLPLTVITHGCNLTSDVAVALQKRHGAQIQVSLPTVDPANFRFLTGGAKLEEALHGLVLASRLGVATSISGVVTAVNADEAMQLGELALAVNARYLLLNRYLDSGRGKFYSEDFNLSPEAFMGVVDRLKADKRFQDLPIRYSGAMPGVRRRKAQNVQLSVSYDGQVSLCNMEAITIGSLQDDPDLLWRRGGAFWQSDQQVAGCHCSHVSA